MVEKALEFSDAETCKKLIDEIIASPPGMTNPMAAMIKDQFASEIPEGSSLWLLLSIIIQIMSSKRRCR